MRYTTEHSPAEELADRVAEAASVFSLHTLQHYSEHEHERRQWLDGDRAACGRATYGWVRHVLLPAEHTDRTLRRVHMFQFPITPSVAFAMECYRHTVAAGEDVRIIPVPWGSWPERIPHGVPRQDFWIVDDVVADLDYDEHGALLRMHVTDDPARLASARAAQAAAWGAATPWQQLWPGYELRKPR